MRLIAPDLQLVDLPTIHDATAPIGPVDMQLRKLRGPAAQLLGQGGDVIEIDMGVAHGVDKGCGDEVAGVGEHVGEEGVGGDVEGHAETHVAGALVQQAGELAFCFCFLLPFFRVRGGRLVSRRRQRIHATRRIGIRDVELREHVAGRQRHGGQVFHVPRAEQDAPVEGAVPQFAHDLADLIDALAAVVGVAVGVLGAEVAPLEAVHRSQVAFFARLEAECVQLKDELEGQGKPPVSIPTMKLKLRDDSMRGNARRELEIKAQLYSIDLSLSGHGFSHNLCLAMTCRTASGRELHNSEG
ncbi:hypothetical protein EPUS_01893 [Endocarpon pusillum Z07020]|uniref:Uncharacterized protein n=1 Tax=Endocarpon pusillum (strain Z07020 / HMAS-L-300199) TaxID=1263415 RepID=U1GBY1_ENDPU|nr:uncharacterized protein EPUS_01893 [Endocarpon pusillum Z07020]ERF69563.1 hypothetical protein EPUS_01893 [Endocarpon pusillum Z07020]